VLVCDLRHGPTQLCHGIRSSTPRKLSNYLLFLQTRFSIFSFFSAVGKGMEEWWDIMREDLDYAGVMTRFIAWTHVWRLRSLFLGTGYDKWYQSYVDCRTSAQLEQSLLRTSVFQIICQNYHLTLISWFYKILWSHTLLFLNDRWFVPAAPHARAPAVYLSVSWHLGTCHSLKNPSPTYHERQLQTRNPSR
jgi:hypothetical protein